MTVDWLDPGEERAWRSLMEMQDGLSEFIERQLRNRCGLSHADYQVLAHLSEAPDGRLRSFELGARLHWEKSRLSQHLGRMQQRGLVSRERCRTDQRGAVVVITAAGADLIEAAAPQHLDDVRTVLIDHLTPAELDILVTIGAKVQDRLAALGQERTESPSPPSPPSPGRDSPAQAQPSRPAHALTSSAAAEPSRSHPRPMRQ